MTINFSDFKLIKKHHGNGVNKIYQVIKKDNNEEYIIKVIKLEDED
jgi:hypothetical protein